MTQPLTLTALFDALARSRGSAPAIQLAEQTVSFAALRDESRRVARGLADLGVGAGDRVALWLPNTPAWIACLIACARLGAIALATNTRFRSAEMEDILGRSGAKVLVYWPAYRGIDFSAIVEELSPAAVQALAAIVAYREPSDPAPPKRVHGIPVHGYDTLSARPALDEDHAAAEAGCVMFTTSGTTKAPKFVLHTQRSIVHHAREVARGFGYTAAGAVGLGVLPFCGTYGFSTALAPLSAGAPLVVSSTFHAGPVLELIARYRVTNTNLTGDMVGQLLSAARDHGVFGSIRFAGCGTGCAQWIEPAARHGLRLVGLYGSSEVQALFSHQNEIEQPLQERAAGGGRPVSPDAEVRARDVVTGKVLPHGESGELEIRAPSLLTGYFNNPEATREAFTGDGFFRTGDLGHTVADGRFIYHARMGDALRLSGFLVSPVQIESVLAEHPAVLACQVVGAETAEGLRPYAFITLRPEQRFDEAELIAFARARMARYKVPARVVRLDAFPTVQSANAVKVQKARLREMAEALAVQAG